MTDLRDHKVLSSFKSLFDACAQDPERAYRILCQAQNTPEAYPVPFAVTFLFGLICGAMQSGIDGYEKTMGMILNNHLDLLDAMDKLGEKPSDYIGPKRKYGKTGQFPGGSAG